MALSRRSFTRLVLAAGLGTALGACGEPAPKPTAAPAPTKTEVARLATSTPVPPSPSATSPVTPEQVPATPESALTTELPEPTESPLATETPPAVAPYLAVARGADPEAITLAAVAALGGIERFVKVGYDVIVKPNVCVDYRTFEYGATTNPQVVATLVRLCLGAGARRVRVMDFPFAGSSDSAYARSGIGEAVGAAGGQMVAVNPAKFRKVEIPEGRDIRAWPIYADVLDADLLINVPIAKHHSSARLSLGCKNLMGVIRDRSQMHISLGQRIADITSRVRPALTVVDAVRTLMSHGPTGGNLSDVRLANTVIASHDVVAADAFAATLFDMQAADVPYIRAAADMGIGTLDLETIHIEEISV